LVHHPLRSSFIIQCAGDPSKCRRNHSFPFCLLLRSSPKPATTISHLPPFCGQHHVDLFNNSSESDRLVFRRHRHCQPILRPRHHPVSRSTTPALSSLRTSFSDVSFSLPRRCLCSHPLPILNISEHYTRTRLQQQSNDYKSPSLPFVSSSPPPSLISYSSLLIVPSLPYQPPHSLLNVLPQSSVPSSASKRARPSRSSTRTSSPFSSNRLPLKGKEACKSTRVMSLLEGPDLEATRSIGRSMTRGVGTVRQPSSSSLPS
jgi:hypothetical protein